MLNLNAKLALFALDFPHKFLKFFKKLNFRLFNSIFDVYKKNYYSYKKIFNIKFVQLFKNNNFYV